MANKISLIFEAIGADKLAQAFGQVQSGAEKAGASAEKAGQGAAKAGQSAGDAAKHVDVLGLSLNKMSGLAGQAGVDLSVFQRAAQGAHESMTLLSGGFSAGTVAAGIFVTGIAAMTGVLVAASQHLVSSYNEIKTFSAVSGMAAGDADDLADAMQAVGVSSQQLSMALFKLEDDAAGGGEALLKLGITMDDLKSKSSGELFVSVIDKIQELGSQSEKTAALTELFGARLGRAFAELVREGGASIDELIAKVQDLSPWTKEMETNARNLAVAQTFLQNAIGGVVNAIGNAFAPVLTAAITTMTDWAVSLRKAIETGPELSTVISTIVLTFTALKDATTSVISAFRDMGGALSDLLAPFNQLAGMGDLFKFESVTESVRTATQAIRELGEVIKTGLAAAFLVIAGPAAFFASILGDIANKQMPDLKKASLEATIAMNQAFVRMAESAQSYNDAVIRGVRDSGLAWKEGQVNVTGMGVAAERAAPSIRTVGDDMKKAADAAKTAAEAFASAGQKLSAIAGSFQSADAQKLAQVANEFAEIARKVDALGPKFAGLAQQIREMGAAAVELTKGQQALKAFADEAKAMDAINTIFANLQKSIDAIHMTEAEKELSGFREQLEKISGLGPDAIQKILNVASGMIATRDAAKEAVQPLKDAADYMKNLTDEADRFVSSGGEYDRVMREMFDTVADVSKMSAATEANIDYANSFKIISANAQLFGKDFDAIGAQMSAMNSRIQFLLKQSGGVITEEIENIREAMKRLAKDQSLEQFADSFAAIGKTFVKDVVGDLINGTLDIEDAFKGLATNLVTNFADRVIDDVFGYLLDGADSFVFDFIDTIVSGLQNFDWGGFFSDLFSFIGGFFGSSGGGGGAFEWSDIGLDAYAHGGRVRRTGPAVVHEGEMVVPADYGGGWHSPGFTPMARGGGGAVPVHVQNFDEGGNAFSAAFDYGKLATKIGTKAYDFAAPYFNMPTTNQIIREGIGQGVSYVGSLFGAGAGTISTGASYGAGTVFTAGLSSQAFGTAFAGGEAAAVVFGEAAASSFTAGLSGAEFGVAFGGEAVAPVAGGGGFSLVGASGAALAPGLIGGGAVLAIPAIAGFFANMGQAEKEWNRDQRRGIGAVVGANIVTQQGAVRSGGIDINDPGVRGNLALLGAGVQSVIEPTFQAMNGLIAAQERGEGNYQDLINMHQGQIDLYNRFMGALAGFGITPDVQGLEEGSTIPGVKGGPMGFWTEETLTNWLGIFDGFNDGVGAVVDTVEDAGDSMGAVADGVEDAGESIGVAATTLDRYGIKLAVAADHVDEAMGAVAANMRTALIDAMTEQVMADPIKLLPFLDIAALRRDGETVEQTIQRVGGALLKLGDLMNGLEVESLALVNPLGAATLSFQQTIAAVEGADWAGLMEGLQSADPTDWVEAATTAHDLLIARYQAEMALIQAITEAIGSLYAGANALVGTAARLQTLGIMPAGGMEFAGLATEFGTQAFGSFLTPEMNLTAGAGAVGLFATQSMMAAKALSLPGLESAMRSAGNLVQGFTATIDQINLIQDPSERMAAFTTVLGQVGDASEAAANAAITYWTTLHDVVAGMMEQLNTIAGSIAGAGNAIAQAAPWLMQAGVNVQALGVDMLNLINLFPTMGAKLTLLSQGVQTFVAGISKEAMAPLINAAAGINTAPAGAPYTAALVTQITDAFQPVLTGFFNTFVAAMQVQDPGQRMAALTTLLTTISGFLGSLPPEIATALVSIFGPEIQTIIGAITTTGAAQAAAAQAIATQLTAIIGPSGALNPENFLLMTVQGIKDSLGLIITAGGPLFERIATGMVEAGGSISTAIGVAGTALSNALGGFATPAGQLVTSLNGLSDTIQQKVYDGVHAAITNALSGNAQSGLEYVPQTGIYMLHQGEGVLTAEQNAAFNRGMLGSYATGTFVSASTARSMMTLLQGISTTITTVMPQGFMAITAAWTVAGQAYGMLIDKLGAGWDIVGSAYANLISVITAGWGAMPAIMAEAVTVGINEALSARGLASGTNYVPSTGLYMLHQGEAVIPAGQNYEHAGASGRGVTVTLSFGDIHLARGGRQEAEEFISTVEASIKHGRLRNAVQDAGKGLA